MTDELDQLIESSLKKERAKFESSLRPLRAFGLVLSILALAGLVAYFVFFGSDALVLIKFPMFYLFLAISVGVGMLLEHAKARLKNGAGADSRMTVEIVFGIAWFIVCLVSMYAFGSLYEAHVT